ncbi:protein OS-9 isoform X2 [Hyperolius riggenbachi]|uniref:protein OS-9 isoform X2 n=1 Tax=Hyperolius riggenbachi TaxID=752182 RepID=UPI0035A2AA96
MVGGSWSSEEGACCCTESRKMAVCGVWVLLSGVLGLLVGLTSASLGFLNLEELTEMKYGIEILSEPVIKGQSKADNIVTIASKYKQNYECKLPAVAVKFQQEKDDDPQTYSGLGISDLLKPMEAAACLTKTKDWWTYEFCYGKHIQQYHIEESEVKGDILYLGYYQSEFDWNNETAKASKHHKLKRYHSQMYVNGSKCDLNGKSRETEVRFVCEEGSGDYIARVDEPQSCTYVLTVHTTRICNHPFLRPPSSGMPQSIRCHPALSPEQYVEYFKAKVSDTKRIVEELSEELKSLDLKTLPPTLPSSLDQGKQSNVVESVEEHQQENAAEESTNAEDESAVKQEHEDTEGSLWDEMIKSQHTEMESPDIDPMQGMFSGPNNPPDGSQGTPKTLRYRIIRNPEDLIKFIEDLKKPDKKDEKQDAENNEVQSDGDSSPVDGVKDAEDEDEQALMQEFEKELEHILLPKSDVSQMKENVKTEMEKDFNNIIDEAQEELETEGLKGEFDRKQATKSLATTLNKLIDKLDTAAAGKGEETDSDSKDDSAQNLEPAVNPPTGKIEIKILTGDFGEDDDGHWLSDEDTKNLKEIFFNLLIHGSEDAHKEQKRQQQLEDNYRFVWNQNQEETKSSSSTDSDDVDF